MKTKLFRNSVYILITLFFFLVSALMLSDFFHGYFLDSEQFYNYSHSIADGRWHDDYSKIKLRHVPDNNSTGEENVIFAGCSYIYGYGIQDHETLANQFARMTKKYKVYNLGYVGGGLHNVIYNFLSPEMYTKVVEGKKTTVLLGIHSDQVGRAGLNKTHCCTPKGPKFIVEGKKLKHIGFLEDPRQILSTEILDFYKVHSNIFNYTELNQLTDFFFFKSKELYFKTPVQQQYCNLVSAFKNLLNQKNISLKVFSYEDFERSAFLKQCLLSKKVKVLDVLKMNKDFHVELNKDKHPNGEYNKILATQILKILSE